MKGLFLDDERRPSVVDWIKYPKGIEWDIVRDFWEFKRVIQEGKTKYSVISFDYDLGPNSRNNGMDCLQVLLSQLMGDVEDNLITRIPEVFFHTKFPGAKEKMQKLFDQVKQELMELQHQYNSPTLKTYPTISWDILAYQPDGNRAQGVCKANLLTTTRVINPLAMTPALIKAAEDIEQNKISKFIQDWVDAIQNALKHEPEFFIVDANENISLIRKDGDFYQYILKDGELIELENTVAIGQEELAKMDLKPCEVKIDGDETNLFTDVPSKPTDFTFTFTLI